MSERIDVQCYTSGDRVVINIVPENSIQSTTLNMTITEAKLTAANIMLAVKKIVEEQAK